MCGIFAYLGNELSDGQLETNFAQVQSRGPDFSSFVGIEESLRLGFHRLAIMDPTPAGNQPFYLEGAALVCNGEIYNHEELAERYGFEMKTGSDCEVILHMFKRFGMRRTCEELDGVFCFAIVEDGRLFISRDPIGVRPLFVGWREDMHGKIEWLVSSEMKGMHHYCQFIEPFAPGTYAVFNKATRKREQRRFYRYEYPVHRQFTEESVMANIRQHLIAAVDKRMMSDRPIGCLLSGGVDSSLVAALVARHYPNGGLHTFNVGLDIGASDRGFARMVAEKINSTHHEVTISKREALDLLRETVRVCESFDTTTIRASTMQLALAKYIQRETDIKVIFNGDVIDEASGSYVYFKNAPTLNDYQEESVRLMREIHLFDVLRADRTISGCGLEARLPFGDLNFLQYYMAIPPVLRRPRDGIEKYLLRKSFEGFLPEAVLWRPKEAFSDGCSEPEESWYSIIQAFVETQVSEEEMAEAEFRYPHCTPRTKEQFYYRKIFEQEYPGRASVIPHFWMPKWCGEDVVDPSARVLIDVYRPASADDASSDRKHDLDTEKPIERRSLKVTG